MKRRCSIHFREIHYHSALYVWVWNCSNQNSETLEPTLHVAGDPDENMTEEDRTFWHSVTMDIKENSHLAVTVLNDLLNFMTKSRLEHFKTSAWKSTYLGLCCSRHWLSSKSSCERKLS
jgi:hypothetical protein